MRRALRWSLFALLIPAAYVALLQLLSGLIWASIFFRADRPFAISMWLAQIFFPIYLLLTVRSYQAKHFYLLVASAWAFVGFWVFHTFIWIPSAFGGPWGW